MISEFYRWCLAALASCAWLLCLPAQGLEPTHRDVPYGPHPRNTLDIWLANAPLSTPVIVHFHGGGFERGGKGRFTGRDQANLEAALAAGVSVATVAYRFLPDAPLQEILRDGARAVQFLRHQAPVWRLDPARVAAYGSSAGGGMALWLAFRDDIADPGNPDPVLRASSRLSAVGAISPQATYDFAQWSEILGIPGYIWGLGKIRVAPRYYGLHAVEMYRDTGAAVRAEVDLLRWIDPGDPPVYLHNSNADTALTYRNFLRYLLQEFRKRVLNAKTSTDLNFDLLHHPAHARALEQACRASAVPVAVVYRDSSDTQWAGLFDFLISQVAKTGEAADPRTDLGQASRDDVARPS